MSVRLDISVQLVWAIANTEANLAGESYIRPLHFFLGILKLADPHFLKHLTDVAIGEDERRALIEISKQIRHYLEMQGEEVAQLRRSLRVKLRKRKPEHRDISMLHRTEDSRCVFRKAISKVVQAGGTTLSALQLAEGLFDSGCVSLDSLKSAQSRPSSKGARWEMVEDKTTKRNGRFREWPGRNLSDLADKGRLAPFEGRTGELRKMLRVLARTGTRHIAIIGKSGVGKTALVEGLASTLTQGNAPSSLTDYEILELHGSDIASDCESEAEVCRRISHLFGSVKSRKSPIIVLDDFDGIFPDHLKPDAISALLTTILTNQEMPCIVTALPARWKKLEDNSPSLTRRFQLVRLSDPPQDECRQLADAWSKRIASTQDVTFEAPAIAAIIKAAEDMPEERAMPDRIVDLIESAATFVKVAALTAGTTRKQVTSEDIYAVLEEQYGFRMNESE